MRVTITFFIIFLTCLLANCAGRSKLADPGVGQTAADPAPARAAPVPSIVNIPAEVKTAYIEKSVNDLFGGTFLRDAAFSFGGFSDVRISLRKNGDIKIRAQGGELVYSVPLKISMRFSITISALGLSHTEYQDADAGIAIGLRTKISLKNNWRLSAKTTAGGYTWTSAPTVKIRALTIPVKPAADFIVSKHMGDICELIDKALNATDLKTIAAPHWEKLQIPMEASLPGISQKLWLRFDPTDVYMSQLSGRGGSVHATLGVRAAVEAFFGDKPEARPPKPLPDFKTPEGQDSTFTINLYTEIPYDRATAICREAFNGKTFRSGLQKVTVHDIEVSSANGLAKLKMELTGSLNGTVYVTGRAVYSEATKSLSIDDFEYDITTDSRFQRAKNRLLKGIITAKMKPLMKFPLGEALGDATPLLQKILADYEPLSGIAIYGKVDTLTVSGVEMTDSAFRAAVLVKGTAGARVTQ